MGARIHGITIKLQNLTSTGTDAFNIPTYSETWENVDNVIVGLPTDAELVDAMDLYGTRAVYVLGVPKGDTHDWSAGKLVEFFGEQFRIFGHTIQGIDDMVPLEWNKKIMVANDGGRKSSA